MKGIVLDKITEGSGACYLVKIKLRDYIESLPEDYKDYEVQREIVANVYLDNLIQTVLEEKHIPSLVLVSESENFQITGSNFEVSNFKILDGLQRTFRLKSIFETIRLLINEYPNNPGILNLSKIQLSKLYKSQLENFGGSSIQLGKVVETVKSGKKSIQDLDSLFDKYQWFEIWTGLSEKSEVEKMLVLNAGHKPVKTKHQLELLFRNIIPILQKRNYKEFSVKREKEISSTNFSKQRVVGQFHFSSLITALLSFSEGRPLTSNIDLIQKKQSDYFDDKIFDELLKYEFLDEFINTLLSFDKALFQHYGNEGTKWFGRETTLVGFFAAAGKLSQENESTLPQNSLELLKEKLLGNPDILALDVFERVRNSQDLAKINIGTINKRAVYNGIYDILTGRSKSIVWEKYFKNEES
ncbi:MAG: hypothetical protein JNM57_14660 [Cyclobacteriaceae bacterium]|nr:hypothetical protein [Cyclobacteriaceae bacterium]